MYEGSEARTASAAVPQVEQLRESFDELDTRVRRVVQERPLGALLAALVAGYLVARVTSRI